MVIESLQDNKTISSPVSLTIIRQINVLESLIYVSFNIHAEVMSVEVRLTELRNLHSLLCSISYTYSAMSLCIYVFIYVLIYLFILFILFIHF